ncbi:MAG: CheW protein [Firmicutes bacterium]|nr:CheW protein [Bacillota bacterium]
MSIQLVVFALGKEEYGIDVSAVNGILRTKKFAVTSIPGTTKVIEGMINVRGKINYILNLRSKFGLESKDKGEDSKFIMLNVDDANTGCIVDEVTDIVKLEEADVQSAPAYVCGVNANFIKGIAQIDNRMIIILNPNNILTFEDHATLENASNSILINS